MVVIINNRREWQILQALKELDIQQCSFCQRTNILNLGWKPFGKFYCRLHKAEHVLCPELCWKVARNILGCELFREKERGGGEREKVAVNKEYYRASCYSCGKELQGAGKHGIVKNRNNPEFWGVRSEWKILCLRCMGKKYYRFMKAGKKKTFNKYLKRGYV